jgi:hypothetical protein
MNGIFERWHPLFIGAIIAIFHLFFLSRYTLPFPKSGETKDLLSAIISLSGITIGFLATAQSIILSLGNNRVIKFLKGGDGKKYNLLINYLMDAIVWSFFLAVLSSIGILFNPKIQECWNSPIFSLWILVLITATLSYYRVIRIFSKLLRSNN